MRIHPIATFSFALLVFATLTQPAAAQDQQQSDGFQSIARPSDAPRTIREAVEHLQRPKASVVEIDDYTSSFLIPAAGSVQGNNGTFFRSDMAISNTRSVDQAIGVGWLAQGVPNGSALLDYFNIPANTTSFQDDFVAVSLGKTGLGAIVVFAVTSTTPHANDSSGRLNAFSRIWTPQPGSVSGTVSQGFPAISLTDSIGSLTARAIGLKQSSQFRTNVGVVNLDSVQHTWTVRSLATGVTFTITVPGYSMNQVGAPANSGSSAGNAAFSMQSDGFGSWWSAYGTSVDNTTGDGWVSRAIQ